MGCFNLVGAFSKLPITAGDRVFAMLGIFSDNDEGDDFFAPGHRFTPCFFPVFGHYDDYGNIERIDEDDNTRFILDFFGKHPETEDINEFMRLVYDIHHDSDEPDWMTEATERLIDRKKCGSYYSKNGKFHIGWIMDHEFIYDEMSKPRTEAFYADIVVSYEATKDFGPINGNDKIEEVDREFPFMLEHKFEKVFKDWVDAEKDGKYKVDKYLRVSYIFPTFISKDASIGWYNTSEYSYPFFLNGYIDQWDFLFDENHKDMFCKMLYFRQYCNRCQIKLEGNTYGSQDPETELFYQMELRRMQFMEEKHDYYKEYLEEDYDD